MKTKLLILFLVIACSCTAQSRKTYTSPNTHFIKNGKLKYSIVLMSCDTCVPISNIGYRVIMKIRADEQKKIKRISKKMWLELLQNKNSDFAANIILYSIHGKDALILSKNNNKELWLKYLKKDDINYWESNL